MNLNLKMSSSTQGKHDTKDNDLPLNSIARSVVSNLMMTTTPEPEPNISDPKKQAGIQKPTVIASQDKASIEPAKINDDDNADSVAGNGDVAKRFLPAYKKANAALTFPEKVRNELVTKVLRSFLIRFHETSHTVRSTHFSAKMCR